MATLDFNANKVAPRRDQTIGPCLFTRPSILTHPNIPKPMHGTNPRTVMGKAWWDIKRQEAYAKNNYCCWACGVPKDKAKYHNWLEAHEEYDIDYAKGRMVLTGIVALCHSCHNYIHDGRMNILVDNGDMTSAKCDDILNHGDTISKGIDKDEYSGPVANWGRWHIIIDNKRVYSKFKDQEEWRRYYDR